MTWYSKHPQSGHRQLRLQKHEGQAPHFTDGETEARREGRTGQGPPAGEHQGLSELAPAGGRQMPCLVRALGASGFPPCPPGKEQEEGGR